VEWPEKQPKHADSNIKKAGSEWDVRIKFLLPNRQVFDRHAVVTSRTAARKVRDDFFAAFNARCQQIFAEAERSLLPPERPRLTLTELGEKCRDEWWPARGRSADVAEQYFQKLRDYVIPVIGGERFIDTISPDDWDTILKEIIGTVSQFNRPLSESTIRKVKAVLSSALSCAVSQKYLLINPLRGLPYNPHPLDEADRQGTDSEEWDDEDAPAKRMLTDEEAAILLKKAKNTLAYPLIVLQLAFGLRIAEALAVKWSDFDFVKQELKVRFQVKRRKNPNWHPGSTAPKTILQRVRYLKSKAGARDIFIFDDAAELLKTLRKGADEALVCPNERGGLMEPRNAQRVFHAVLELAELCGQQPTTHSLRAYRLSYWANVLALPASQLQRLAGHSRIETTLRFYVRGDTASLKAWLATRAPVGSATL
jgi:integrase